MNFLCPCISFIWIHLFVLNGMFYWLKTDLTWPDQIRGSISTNHYQINIACEVFGSVVHMCQVNHVLPPINFTTYSSNMLRKTCRISHASKPLKFNFQNCVLPGLGTQKAILNYLLDAVVCHNLIEHVLGLEAYGVFSLQKCFIVTAAVHSCWKPLFCKSAQ